MRAPASIAPALLRAIGAAALASTPGAATQAAEQDAVDFSRDVRPILSDNCFQCHGPDPATREAGLRLDVREAAIGELSSGAPAIAPGDADESELVYRIAPEFEGDRMPPAASGKSLTPDEIATLRRWVEEGAAYDEHWSFVAPKRTHAEGGGSIDEFVSRRLRRDGLELRPEADPETLLRRVTLDLTGLPPTPDERRSFLSEVAARGMEAAYTAEVDRLLASPRYGVHMARPWLDAARYADTHGLHLDNRRSMWPYRDWVVDALNENMPFDRFAIEQLAGDLLPDPTLDQQIASGFNRCNPTSAEGGMIAEEYLSIYAKDRADTTATVFLGLTLGCAQCHDHKFDPIRQVDYYGMYAFFNSLSEEATDRNIANPRPFVQAPRDSDVAELESMDERDVELTAKLDAPDPALEAAEEVWREREAARIGTSWRTVVPEAARATGGVELSVDGGTGVVTASGANPAKTSYTIDAWIPPGPVHGVRLDALVPEGKKLPGRASNQNFVLSRVEVLARDASRPGAWEPVPLREAVATYSQDKWPIAATLDSKDETGWAGLGREGDRSALLVPERSFGYAAGTELRVKLHFRSVHAQHAFARLSLAVKRTADDVAELREGIWFHARYPKDAGGGSFAGNPIPVADVEAGLDVTAPAAGGVAWSPEPGYVDDAVQILGNEVGTHYLVRRIWTSAAREAELRLGSDDTIEVWLRGEKLLAKNVGRAAQPDQEVLPVRLEPGTNELVLKIVNTGGPGAFAYRLADPVDEDALTADVELAVLTGEGGASEARDAMRLHYRKKYAPAWAEAWIAREALRERRAAFERDLPTTMVSEELDERRPAHVLMRGLYDQKGEVVTARTPAALPPMPADLPRNRLGLARWIVSGDNPLTARVWVNRAWQHFFGRGIVVTPEDFGAQGAWPTHPELLDWLAVTFTDSGWDMKAMHRRIALSRAYRQDSAVPAELLEHDPDNALVSRGPRHRLDGEVLRDQALYVAGLLDETMGGPGVRPYQPDGVWFAVGYSRSNTVRYQQGPLEHLHRRSLYTFWKRTAPPPNLTTFDAPMRDACTVARERTNTPLQALVTLNDPTYVEAARFAAENLLLEAESATRARVTRLFERIVGREPASTEHERLTELADVLTAEYRATPDDAAKLLQVGDRPAAEGVDVPEHAAWTLVASTLLNLDEVLTKN